jgi:hypothetical protein
VWIVGHSLVEVLHGSTWLLRRINGAEGELPVAHNVARKPRRDTAAEPKPKTIRSAEVVPDAYTERLKLKIHKTALLKAERGILTTVGADGKRRREQSHGREARLLAEEQVSRRRNITMT